MLIIVSFGNLYLELHLLFYNVFLVKLIEFLIDIRAGLLVSVTGIVKYSASYCVI
jgi:hypothetical protein